jgi:rare lipoprotein A
MRQSLSTLSLFVIAALFSSFAIRAVEEFGKAGYYADSLHGRKTASGEVYDKNDLTCAHKSLPYGTKVRVTRLDNKKSVVVRVNDRGPFIDGYVVDVSRRAAEEIGLIKDGITRVKVEVVEAATQARVAAETGGDPKLLVAREEAKQIAKGGSATKATKPATHNADTKAAAAKGGKSSLDLYQVAVSSPAKSGYCIQVSTLSDADNVLPVLKKIQADWPGKALVLVNKDELNNTSTSKVLIGPFSDKKTADAQQKLAVKKGFKKCFVVDLATL